MCMVLLLLQYIIIAAAAAEAEAAALDNCFIKTELKHFLGIYAGAINKLH
jgi:hypothetical protein